MGRKKDRDFIFLHIQRLHIAIILGDGAEWSSFCSFFAFLELLEVTSDGSGERSLLLSALFKFGPSRGLLSSTPSIPPPSS